MYGFDKEIDFTFLVGRSLVQICVGLFQIILNFDDGVSISIEGTFEHIFNGVMPKQFVLPDAAFSLIGLLGTKIEDVKAIDKVTLEIKFSDCSTLRLKDSNPNTESFQISSPLGEIIV